MKFTLFICRGNSGLHTKPNSLGGILGMKEPKENKLCIFI